MTKQFLFLAASTLAFTTAFVACGDDEETTDTPTGSTTPTTGGEGAGGPGTGAGAPNDDEATIQLGHLNRDAGAVDVCVSLEGGDFQKLTDGGIDYPSITESTTVPAGTYDVHLVGVGAECTGDVAAEFEAVIPGGFEGTIAVLGTSLDNVSLLPVPEALSGPPAGTSEIVAVHAAPDYPTAENTGVDVGLITPVGFVRLAEGATFGSAAAIPLTADLLPVEDAVVGVSAAGGEPVVAITDFDLAADQQLTIYVVLNDDGAPEYFPVANGTPGVLTNFVDPPDTGEGANGAGAGSAN